MFELALDQSFRSDKGLTIKISAMDGLYSYKFRLSTQLNEPTPHRRKTPVSLETYPLYVFIRLRWTDNISLY